MNKNLHAILVCPICKTSLNYNDEKQELLCHIDKLAFKINEGIPNMVVENARLLTVEEINSNF